MLNFLKKSGLWKYKEKLRKHFCVFGSIFLVARWADFCACALNKEGAGVCMWAPREKMDAEDDVCGNARLQSAESGRVGDYS